MEPRELPIVAGHLALDFANTVDDPLGPTRHDHIGTYAELLRWSVRTGVLTVEQSKELRGSAAALRKAHTLRDVLNEVFVAAATGNPPEWAGLRPFVANAVANSELAPSHELTWPVADAPHAMLWPVAYAAERLLTSPDIHRVKQCAGCPWVFLDHSRNGSRRWCAMNDCGTHAKVRKYVAKRAASRKR
jgi:predicted RNA-binding Zn ribbon-like protein